MHANDVRHETGKRAFRIGNSSSVEQRDQVGGPRTGGSVSLREKRPGIGEITCLSNLKDFIHIFLRSTVLLKPLLRFDGTRGRASVRRCSLGRAVSSHRDTLLPLPDSFATRSSPGKLPRRYFPRTERRRTSVSARTRSGPQTRQGVSRTALAAVAADGREDPSPLVSLLLSKSSYLTLHGQLFKTQSDHFIYLRQVYIVYKCIL